MAYKKASEEASEEGLKEVQSGANWFKPSKGENRIRILPPHEDHPNEKWYEWVALHGNLPGAGKPVKCPAKMYDKPCPACIVANQYYARGDKDGAREFSSTWRALVNLVELDTDGEVDDDAEITTWAMPRGTLEDLNALIKKLPKGKRDISDPETGRDVIITKKGTGQKTQYRTELAGDPSEVDAVVYELLDTDDLRLLGTIYPDFKPAQIEAFLEAAKGEDPWDDDDEDEAPPPRKAIAAPKKGKAVEAEYRVVEEDDEDDDDPPPAPRRAKKAKPVEEDEEEEDEDAAPAKAPKKDKAAASGNARDKLLSRLRKVSEPDEDEDDDDEEDDDD
jgi:hypothetical protein